MAGDAEFWEEAYRTGQDGWELGEPSPPLVRALGALPPGEAAVVLGCGRGHEARAAASAGWTRVLAVDFAPSAIAGALRLSAGVAGAERIEWRRQDLFTLGATDPGRFDLCIEHTCFCAIDPDRRGEWAEVVRTALRPGGALVALFYAHGRPGGPPFTTDRAEVLRLLGGAGLRVDQIEIPADSVARRETEELLVVARRT